MQTPWECIILQKEDLNYLIVMPDPHGTRALPELQTLNELIYYFQA